MCFPLTYCRIISTSCFEVSLDAPGMENEPLHKKNLSFGIGFTADLKIWISQVDLSYACADPEGYGGLDHLENHKFYRFQ